MSKLFTTIAAFALFAATIGLAPVRAETNSANPMDSGMPHHGMMGGMMGQHRGSGEDDQTGMPNGMKRMQDMMSMMNQCDEMMQSQATPPNGPFKTAPDDSPAR